MEELRIDPDETSGRPATRPPARFGVRSMGILWLVHGILLVVVAGLVGACQALLRFIESTNKERLLEEDLANLAYVEEVIGHLLPMAVIGGTLAVPVLLGATAFLRRKPWGWQAIHALTWLHLLLTPLLVVPMWQVAGMQPPQIPGAPAGADEAMQSIQLVGQVVNLVLLLAMEVLLVFMLRATRSPAVRRECGLLEN